MNGNKSQLIFVSLFIAFFFILYFGCETKPNKQALIEKSRVLNQESTDIRVIMADAKKKIKTQESSLIDVLETDLSKTIDDSLKMIPLEKLASQWYQYGFPEISGYYAEQIADLDNLASSWSIAGTTFGLCLKAEKEDKIRSYCSKHAVESFENAISLEPRNIDHSLNMALVYVDRPPKDNPMKGIQLLLGLNDKNPNNTKVLNQLGRLSMGTNQWENALKRLLEVLDIDPDNKIAICMLPKVYEALGDKIQSNAFKIKCEDINQ